MLRDDPKLLDMMLRDLAQAPPVYQPTNYWHRYNQTILPELKRLGLRSFRRRHGSYIASFGATDHVPEYHVLLDNRRINNPSLRKIPGFFAGLSALDHLLSDVLLSRVFKANTLYGMRAQDIEQLGYDLAAEEGRRGLARPLRDLQISLEGDPARVFYRDGQPMTVSLLYYYMRYAYVSRFVDFERVRHIVELGSGSGKQAEVLAKLHPNVCLFLFDIPPELYVCEQYLKAALGDRVVSFRECRTMTTPPPLEPGRVYLFGNWQFPLLAATKPDIFWNAASFQEMEPDVVKNYLGVVKEVTSSVFIQAIMTGAHRAKRKGEHGVLAPITLQDFERFLDGFRSVDVRLSRTPLLPPQNHSDSFWVRRDPVGSSSAIRAVPVTNGSAH